MQMVLSGTVPTNKLRQTLDLYCLIRIIKGQVILSVIAGWEWLYAGEGREDGAGGGGGGWSGSCLRLEIEFSFTRI